MALVSREIRAELATLVADPIIADMAAEIDAAIERGELTLEGVAAGGYGLMQAARNEYAARGGTNAETIGGPQLALMVKLGITTEAEAFARKGAA